MSKENKASFTKLIPIIFKHGIKIGKTKYVILILLNLLLSFSSYFWMSLTEVSTNTAYKLMVKSKDEIDMIKELNPLFIIVTILFVITIFGIIRQLLFIRVSRDLHTGFDTLVTDKLSKMTWENYETHKVSMKIEMVKRDGLNAFEQISIHFIQWLTGTIVYFIIYILIVGRIGWWVSIIFFLAAILYIYIGIYCGNKAYQNYRNTDAIYKQRSYLYRCSQSKEGHQDSIVNRLYNYLSKRWKKANDTWMDMSIKSQTRASLYTFFPNIVFAFIAGGILYLTVKVVQSGEQEIGYFTLICTTIISLGMNLRGITSSLSWYEKDLNVYQDYLELMEYENELSNNNRYLKDEFLIQFKNIEYIYPQSTHKALNGLNIAIKDHETIAIVGVNGSGKTTFVNILMELSKKYQGEILVNHENINESLGVLRNSCSCIFQDFLQYQFSIKENIIIGDKSREISDEEIYEILKNVGLYDFVEKLPDGINTMLGQINNGTELSKGQWQRLAVARLLANKESKIWILDEPTAYLDPIGEIEMYNFIYKLKEDRTIIFISHRLGFAKRANRIIVFKDGKVIEDANHEQLIANSSSEYAKMYEKQKSWYE